MTDAIYFGILVFAAVTCLGGAILAYRSRDREVFRRRLSPGPETPREKSDMGHGPLHAVGKLGSAIASRPSRALRQNLARAGLHSDIAAPIYMGAKAVLLIAGAVVAWLLTVAADMDWTIRMFLVAMCGVVMFFVPNFVVNCMLTKRQEEVRYHLPDAIDLLEICVSSGMGLETAWNLVGDEFRQVSPVMADEITLTNLEIHLGVPRAMAMRHMAARTGADELSSLVAILIQSERFGTSIADALQVFAASIRDTRSAHIEENAEKMAVKLLFPMILFIFPLVMVIVAGPAMLRLMHVISTY